MNLNEIFEYKEGNLYWKKKTSLSTIVGNKAGTLRKDGYIQIRLNKKCYLAHRLIWSMFNDSLPKIIDHINGNKQDNRIENLRKATQSQNLQNSKLSNQNTSGHKNISWVKRDKKWLVQLIINKNHKNFGSYYDLEVAKFVAETMRYKYFGKFANHG